MATRWVCPRTALPLCASTHRSRAKQRRCSPWKQEASACARFKIRRYPAYERTHLKRVLVTRRLAFLSTSVSLSEALSRPSCSSSSACHKMKRKANKTINAGGVHAHQHTRSCMVKTARPRQSNYSVKYTQDMRYCCGTRSTKRYSTGGQ